MVFPWWHDFAWIFEFFFPRHRDGRKSLWIDFSKWTKNCNTEKIQTLHQIALSVLHTHTAGTLSYTERSYDAKRLRRQIWHAQPHIDKAYARPQRLLCVLDAKISSVVFSLSPRFSHTQTSSHERNEYEKKTH